MDHITDDDLKAVFDIFDENGNGSIDETECRHGLVALGVTKVTEVDVDAIMGPPTTDGSLRSVELETFKQRFFESVSMTSTEDKRLEEAFKLMDRDGNNAIKVDDLQAVAMIIEGRPRSLKELNEIVKTASRGGDAIRFGDFCHAVSKYQPRGKNGVKADADA
eukprot:TRINITY_DN21429_c0_g1_i1.p2 TRINITY_DN21429_c0_g1~~TRINITY_DN21429_c0_g1_i1.p2  ORF type:complete len:163 (+),score=61.58 TRINITY_DN21429_c0_g1_i1:59-547(+)